MIHFKFYYLWESSSIAAHNAEKLKEALLSLKMKKRGRKA